MRAGLIGAAVLALAGCGKAVPEARPDAPPQVRIARVGGVGSVAEVSGVGTVALRRESQLGFTSPGRVLRVMVNEGDQVRPGQLLASLDATSVSADVARAVAERDRAGAEYRRSETLLRQGWVTRPRVESARAAYLAAQAQVSAAGFQRGAASVTAPGAGIVLARLVEPGQVVAAGTPVIVLGEAASGLVLRVPLSDRDAARVRPGAPAVVTVDALGPEPFAGQVVEVGGRADRATGTFAVEVALPPAPGLRSGQIGSVRIVARDAAATIPRVPPTAVFAARAGEGFVYIVDPATRRATLRKVRVAETGDAGVEVVGGVRPGEFVATSRVDRLRDGMTIQPLSGR